MKGFLRICLALLSIVLFLNGAVSQNIQLIGSIYDSENNQPVLYANLTIPNVPIGTCTNSNGDFLLYLPDSLFKEQLKISCIGYKSNFLSIDSLTKLDTIFINLSPIDYQLEDITVVPGQNDLQTIMENVISRIDNNYSRKKYFLEAFLRHRVYNQMDNEKTTVRLTEAALSIHKNHNSKKENNRVQINEIRNSKNYAELSTSVGRKLLYKALGGNQNPIFRILNVENYIQKKFLKKLIKNEHYSIKLKDVSLINNEIVYVIDFKQISWDFLFKTYLTTHTYFKFRYYVGAKDFAVLKAESSYVTHNPKSLPFVTNDSIQFQSFIQYREFDSKYYPSYVYFYGGIPDMVSEVNKEHFYSHEAEMLINELATRRKDYDRIKSKYRMDFKTTLWDMDYVYNDAFWEDYNLLLDNPLNKKYKNDLEFKEPLEEQFKNIEHVKSRN